METQVQHFSKKFLNLDGHESDAAIFTEIKFRSPESTWVDTTFKIRDCNHQIFLSIECDDEEDFLNSKFKLDILISEITKFKEEFSKAYEESVKRKEIKKQKKEEKNEVDSGNSSTTTMQHIGDPAAAPPNGLDNIQEAIRPHPNI